MLFDLLVVVVLLFAFFWEVHSVFCYDEGLLKIFLGDFFFGLDSLAFALPLLEVGVVEGGRGDSGSDGLSA